MTDLVSRPLPIRALADLNDVTITSIADGEIIVWDSGSSLYINNTLAEAGIAAASHTHTASEVTDFSTAADARIAAAGINALSDVTITAAASGDFLRHNGSAWVDATISASDLPAMVGDSGAGGTKGAVPAPAAGDAAANKFLKADGTWAVGGGGASALDDLSDVVITAAASGDFIRHNGTNWVDATIVASDLPAMVGDSGSGGTKGAAPAPSSGDAAAGKFLKADGTWAVPSGTGGSSHWHDPVYCRTTANVDLAGGGIANGTTHDGITVSTGQRILVPAQSSATENGIYVVPTSGAASRASDMATSHNASGDSVNILAGTLYADYTAIVTSNSSVVGTDPITWGMVDNGLTAVNANYFPAGPVSGSAAVPTYRAMVVADLPLAPYQAHNLVVNSGFWFGSMRKDPANTASISDDNYGMDCWNILSQGATALVSRIAGTNGLYAMRVQNNTGSSNRVGCCQILEHVDTVPLRGQTATFKMRIRCSQTKNLRVAFISGVEAADTVTSDCVASWTSTTFTLSNFYTGYGVGATVNTAQIACTANTWREAVVSGTVYSLANNIILAVTCDDTLSDGEKFDIEEVEFYLGTEVTTARPRRSFADEQARAQRFAFRFDGQQFVIGHKINGLQIQTQMLAFPVTMRADPTGIVTTTPTFNNGSASASQVASYNRNAAAYSTITGSLTVTALSYDGDRGTLLLAAGTSFSGSTNDLQSIDFGSDFHAYWHAFL